MKHKSSVLRFFCRGFLFALPLLVLTAAVNAAVDPASLFHKGYEQQVAEIVTSGKNADCLHNMDDRIFQQDCARLRAKAPHTLVLGSSRSMQLTARGLQQPELFNGSVTNGDLRDMVSLYTLYRSLDKQPQRVILMADYCMFNPAKLDTRAYTEGYNRFAKETGTKPLRTASAGHPLESLFSPAYFQTSLDYLLAGKRHTDARSTDAWESDSEMRRADGSYSYGLHLRGMTEEERIRQSEFTALSIAHNMGAYQPDSEVLRSQFELFVQEMQRDGVEVILQLPPINPSMYAAMMADEEYARQLALEDYFRSFAEKNGLRVFGSYNAGSLGLTQTDFYDALHCSLEATDRYLPDWLKGSAPAQGAELT